MDKFISKLNKIYLNKYRNTLTNINFLKKRNKLLTSILTLENNNKNKNLNFLLKNKIDKKKALFLKLYKKFNYRLKLKYNDIKKDFENKEIDIISYAIFGNILLKNNKLNKLQKLNTICKINDLILLKINKYNFSFKNIININCIKKNIEFEKKTKFYYAKKTISNIK